MRATNLEFRLRLLIMAALVGLGFWAPWLQAWELGGRMSLLEWLALELSRTGLLRFTAATPTVIVLACVIAGLAAWFRVWGTAWVGPAVVNSLQMHAAQLVADGPYRYVRNPLYLGTWSVIAAIAFVMPVSGALVCMILLSVFLLRLILAEEAFLRSHFGEAYSIYARAVPRLFPRLRTALRATARQPQWGRALLMETNALGVFLITAILSWRYDNRLMLRAILINFGLSLVIRAFAPLSDQPTRPAA